MSDDIFLEHRPIIRKAAKQVCNSTGMDYEETEDQANLIFVECVLKFDYSFGMSFKSFLFNKIKQELLDWYKLYEKKQIRTKSEFNVVDRDNNISVAEIFESMKKDVKTLAWLFIDPTIAVWNMAYSYKQRSRHSLNKCFETAIRDYLSNLGWSRRRIRQAFRDLNNTLEKKER
jgi:hypothetical protein